MRKTLVSFLLMSLSATTVYCQRIQPLNAKGSTEISLDVKLDEEGPRGGSSYSFPSNDKVDSIVLAGYPKLKNLPDSLTELKVYTLKRDPMQFYYQNYRNGIYTKQFFLNRFKNNKSLNQDTLKLTNKLVKCYFSYAVGYDSKGNPRYVIDENGNNDFADDQLHTLTKQSYTIYSGINTKEVKNVVIEYFDGKNVFQEKIPCLLNLIDMPNTKDKKITVGISFPQFKYAVISYEGENFYVCADLNVYNKSIYVFPEQPNFGDLSDKYMISPNQIVKIGNSIFRYETISQNQDKIRLIGDVSESDMKVSNTSPTVPTLTQRLNKTGSTEILLDKKVDTFRGPKGNVSMMFASNDMLDSTTLAGYPTLKNLPDSLSGLRIFTYISEPRQFYYQNYRNGIYSKKFFKEYFKKQSMVLSDTTMLTTKMVKCYFSYAIGYDRNKNPKYVIDTNGNNDFADEKLLTINKNSSFELIANNTINVAMEYFDGKNVSSENILCSIFLNRSSTPDKIEASVSFPQFRYAKISYEDESYYICSYFDHSNKSIYLIKARPYFSNLLDDLIIKPNQIATFGNTYFKYMPISQNLNKIKLISGFSSSDKKVLNAKPKVKVTPRPLVSEQVGMVAPEIKGINVQDGTILSLTALRGKYVFLDFWATWCGPCVMEFPYIRKVYDTFSSDQFVIMGVCEDDFNGKIKAFLKDKQVTWSNIIKSASTTKTKGYNIASWPTSYLIGPDGKIITTNLRGDDLFNRLENLKVKKK